MATTISNLSNRLLQDEETGSIREVPHNIDAEQALLGALLVNNESYDRVSSFLKPEHFHEKIHSVIYESIIKLVSIGKLASPITMKTIFDQDESLREIGGSKYIARLASSATSVINAHEYARIIYNLSVWRNLIYLGTDMVNNSYNPEAGSEPDSQIESAEEALYNLAEKGRYGKDFVNFSTALTEAIDMAANAYHRDGNTSGLSSGFKDLDEVLGGLQPSDLLIIAGRPSMGKTAFATNIAYHIASNYRADNPDGSPINVIDGSVVGFFSLEMSSAQLATRIISEQTGVSSEKIRRGKINKDDFNSLVSVAKKLQDIPLFIDESGGINLSQLSARARRLKRQHGLGLIVIDYLQLLTSNLKKYSENRVQEISEITQGLKSLAKELNIPIIALSQLSRQVENRDDKKPQLADLRESGSIEQDADIVMFIFREEYYLQRKEPREGTEEHIAWQENMEQVHQKAEVIIGKNRHGPTNTIQMHFDGSVTKFSDFVSDAKLPERYE
ncbi:MAG: replicative DNA helicase [Alphaproteobacteria bacterium]|jgi:replicative DNA helicase|tara:strand:- start:22088 stop:23593 length:1506 start_codon:yes stop_codon:yes gene_type:complete